MSSSILIVRIETTESIDQSLVDSLRRLYKQLYPDSGQDLTQSLVGPETLASLVEAPDSHLLVAKTASNQIVATATLNLAHRIHGCFAQLESFVVDQDHRGKGIGQLLLDGLIELAEVNQVRMVSLVSGSHRPISHLFYQQAGFKRRDNFYFYRYLDRP